MLKNQKSEQSHAIWSLAAEDSFSGYVQMSWVPVRTSIHLFFNKLVAKYLSSNKEDQMQRYLSENIMLIFYQYSYYGRIYVKKQFSNSEDKSQKDHKKLKKTRRKKSLILNRKDPNNQKTSHKFEICSCDQFFKAVIPSYLFQRTVKPESLSIIYP